MARGSKDSKSSSGGRLRYAKHGLRALMLARKYRAGVKARQREREGRRGPSPTVLVIALVALVSLGAGLYLLRRHIPGPWRSETTGEGPGAETVAAPRAANGEMPAGSGAEATGGAAGGAAAGGAAAAAGAQDAIEAPAGNGAKAD